MATLNKALKHYDFLEYILRSLNYEDKYFIRITESSNIYKILEDITIQSSNEFCNRILILENVEHTQYNMLKDARKNYRVLIYKVYSSGEIYYSSILLRGIYSDTRKEYDRIIRLASSGDLPFDVFPLNFTTINIINWNASDYILV